MEKKKEGAAGIKPFIIDRVFDAPRDLVWAVWTEPKHMAHWSGPKGTTVKAEKLDFKPGGTLHYCMVTPDGQETWGKQVYREIVKPERIVSIQSFSNEKGEILRHPLSQTWPAEMLSTVTFREVGAKTHLTIEWVPWNAGEAEIQTFEGSRDGMRGGWSGTFEKLAEYLAKL